ncbi:MAG: hypothetical protein ACXW3C_07980, partial [Pyrinomonadaceae bacterium]
MAALARWINIRQVAESKIGMTQVFLITERNDLRESLERFLLFRSGLNVHSILAPEPVASIHDRIHWAPRNFRRLVSWIENCGQEGSTTLMGTIAVVEHSSLTSLEELDPLNIYGGWSAVLSMLMLAFPEVHWIILSPCQPAEEFLRQYHFISTPNLFHELEY